jgi:hypothetical protein
VTEHRVFLGPTLDWDSATRLGPVTPHAPAAVGDIHRAVEDGVSSILLIDGYFRQVPSVQHKEILFALSSGVPVYGASSMGALRAAELAAFGMVGVGAIYQAYRQGELTDDDEVAVAHADAEHGFRALSTPMVTIRQLLADAVRAELLDPEDGDALTRLAKQLFYADRHWGTLLERGRAAGIAEDSLRKVLELVRVDPPDPKRRDAVAALELIASGTTPAAPVREFEPTYNWTVLIADENGGTP